MAKRPRLDDSYQHLDAAVVACLQGRTDLEASVASILGSHGKEQIQAVLLGEGERYRHFNRAKFTDLVEELRGRGVLW